MEALYNREIAPVWDKGTLTVFIKKFLTNRKIQVQISDTFSDPIEIKEGIPQGRVLSCTGFLIAINEIADNLPPTL